MKKMIGWLIWVLMVVGAINWGLVAMGMGLFEMRIFYFTFPWLVRPVQLLVGLAGLSSLVMYFMGMFTPSCDVCK